VVVCVGGRMGPRRFSVDAGLKPGAYILVRGAGFLESKFPDEPPWHCDRGGA
jgi:hypothetical protein